MTEYGAESCCCTSYDEYDGRTTWYPMAHCPRHGILAEYTPDRLDTGTYRVIRPDDPDQCPEGTHSMFDPCPGGCLNDELGDTHEHGAGPCEPCGQPAPRPGSLEHFAAERARRDAERGGMLMPGLSEARNDTDEPIRVLSPGSVSCRCGWTVTGLPVAEGIQALTEHATTAHTTKERGVLATVRTWCWRHTNFWPFRRRH
jgi:predicted small metal-binding protein